MESPLLRRGTPHIFFYISSDISIFCFLSIPQVGWGGPDSFWSKFRTGRAWLDTPFLPSYGRNYRLGSPNLVSVIKLAYNHVLNSA